MKYVLATVYVLGIFYLLQPVAQLPTLDNAVLSNEPGDTWQNPDQKGYYTNLTRSQVIDQIQQKSKISVFGISIPNYRLNYRPEESYSLVRDQLKSNYLEEVVYPLKSSIYINGWEPKNAPVYANKPKKEIPDISIYGVPYDAKITLRPVSSVVFIGLLIWTAIFPLGYLVLQSFKRSMIHGK